MTTVYFVRHATPDFSNHNDAARELSAQGLADRKLVTEFLWDKNVDAVLSSPYKRAVDTVKEFAGAKGLAVALIDDFRERKIADAWIADFESFCERQWADFDYKRPNGESLREVQQRNIRALAQVLDTYDGQTVAIGGHGTAICTVLNDYDPSFGCEDFNRIRRLMPWIVQLSFEGKTCTAISEYDLFSKKFSGRTPGRKR